MKIKNIESGEIARWNSGVNLLQWIARLGVFGTFLGHGIVAFGMNPKWIPLFKGFGFTAEQAIFLMPFIGILDIVIALIVLVYPIREVLLWAAFWAFLTALSRPISGEPFVEFIERSANWCLPLLLFAILSFQKKVQADLE
jgi:hypothetical protein